MCCPQQCPWHCPGWGHRADGWTGTLPLGSEGQWACSQWEVGGLGRCHQACQGGQAPVGALGCSLVLLGTSSALEPCWSPDLGCAHPRAWIPGGPCGERAGRSLPERGWGVGAPPAPVHTLPAPQRCREAGGAKHARPGSWDCERADAGLCTLGPWGEAGDGAQRLEPWDPPDLLLPRVLGMRPHARRDVLAWASAERDCVTLHLPREG